MECVVVPQASPHILAVDDDPMIREAIGDYLGRHHFRVTTVADGGAAESVLDREAVDLIVLDLKLRVGDGLTLARRLRHERQIPIIMLTGSGDETEREMGLRQGADDYLHKPLSPRDLLESIRAVLHRRRAEMSSGGCPGSGDSGHRNRVLRMASLLWPKRPPSWVGRALMEQMYLKASEARRRGNSGLSGLSTITIRDSRTGATILWTNL
jgi:DNA-binding response OmpR family regulator